MKTGFALEHFQAKHAPGLDPGVDIGSLFENVNNVENENEARFYENGIRSRTKRLRRTMPSLFRFLTIVAVIAALGYGAMYALVRMVQLKPREITVSVPQDKFIKPPQ